MAKGLPDRVVTDLKDRVSTMTYRMQALHGEFPMTHRECLELVAPPQHIEFLMSATEWADVSSHENEMSVTVPYEIDGVFHPMVDLKMRTHAGKEPPLRPRLPRWHAVDDRLQKMVITWVDHRLATTRMAAAVEWVIEELALRCDSGQQVRYLWPAIMHLCKLSESEHTLRWVDKNGAYRAVKSTPHIGPHLRKALHATSEWLTKASLIDTIEEPRMGQVGITMSQRYDFYVVPKDADGESPVMLTREY